MWLFWLLIGIFAKIVILDLQGEFKLDTITLERNLNSLNIIRGNVFDKMLEKL